MIDLPTRDKLATLDLRNHITRDYHRELQRMSQGSLYFFARYIFGRTGLSKRCHLPLCNFAQDVIRTPNAFGIAEDPRATGKSNAITIPGPAWCLIQDPVECKRRGWLPLGPECNIGVASYKVPFATIFVSETRQTMQENPLFLWLFGHLVPNAENRASAWSKEFFTVIRDKGTGYSVMALGTESGSTSLHPVVLFMDDLLNELNYDSPTEVASQVEWVGHSKNLTDVVRGSRILTENEWSERGVNFSQREKNKTEPGQVKFFSRSRVVCGLCDKGRELDRFGNPIVCEHPDGAIRPILDNFLKEPEKLYTMADVDSLRRNLSPQIWFAQHENNPLAASMLKWKKEWLRFYSVVPNPGGEGLALAVLTGFGGLSGGQGKPAPERYSYTPVSELHVIVALDPGLIRPGLICVGRGMVGGVGEMIFVLDARGETLTPRAQFFQIFDWVLKWGAENICFESAGLQNYILQTIPVMAKAFEEERGVTLPRWVTRPNPDSKKILGVPILREEGRKAKRIGDAVGPFAEGRQIGVRHDIVAFLDEFVIFDKGRTMDVLDAFVAAIKAFRIIAAPTARELYEVGVRSVTERGNFEEAMNDSIGYGEGV